MVAYIFKDGHLAHFVTDTQFKALLNLTKILVKLRFYLM